MLKRHPLLILATAGLLAGCGSSGGSSSAPASAPAAGAAETATRPTKQVDECTAKGITTAAREAGRCQDGDVTRIVARLGTPVRLQKADVTVIKRYTMKAVDGGDAAPTSRAQGRFVIFRMKVKNRSKRPAFWASGVGATALRIGDTVYSADDSTAAFSLAYRLDGDPGLESGEVQAGRSKAAWVAFDVPVAKLPLLKKPGSELLIVDAGDAANGFNAVSETAGEQAVVPLWK